MSPARGASRRSSRQAALQALYAADVAPGSELSGAVGSLAGVAEHFELTASALPFAQELVDGVIREQPALDEKIEAASRHWRLARMAAVDRNILRIAAYELIFAGTPAEVAIDEAVELARRFGDDGSPRFVNGVLGALAPKGDPA